MLRTAGERISVALVSMATNDLGRSAVSVTGSQAGIVTDTVQLTGLQIQVSARQSFLQHADLTKLTVRQVDSLVAELTVYLQAAASIRKIYRSDSTLLASNDKAIQSFGMTTAQLNKATMLVSDKSGPVIWMRHHDASAYARLLNEPRAGAGGHLYVFVHPSSTGGVLLELIQQ